MVKEMNDNQPIVSEGDLRVLLRQLRDKAGYSLTQMADALCLSEDTLEKLESEDFQSLAEPPYIRGYLRNYAKLADSDPEQLINLYESLRGADPSEFDYHFKTSPSIVSNSKSKISPVLGQLLFLGLLLAVISGILMIPSVKQWISATWSSFSKQTTSQESFSIDNPLLTGTMPIPVPLPIDEKPIAKSTERGQTEKSSNTSDSPQTTEKEEQKPEPKNENDTSTPAENVKTEKQDLSKKAEVVEEIPPTTNKELANIRLVFNKEIWMRIKDKTNRTVFEATNTVGNEKVL